MKPYLSVVIPVYKSEGTIRRLIEQLQVWLAQLSFEVVLVNDGSPDNSEAVCRSLAETFANVQFASLRRNFGEFNAVLCGLTLAKGDFAVIIDDDFQNPPEAILTLLHTAESTGADVVYSRYAEKKHALYRNLGSQFLNYCTTWLLNKPKDLYLSSFKLIRREVIDEIIKYQGPYPYIDGLIFRVTRSVTSVVVPHQAREQGQSNYTWRKLISLTLNVFFGYSSLPLRLLLGFGVAVTAVSALLGLLLIIGGLTAWFAVPVWLIVIWVVLFLAGCQLIVLGVLGEYLGKLFLAHSGQPPFVIKYHLNGSGTESGAAQNSSKS